MSEVKVKLINEKFEHNVGKVFTATIDASGDADLGTLNYDEIGYRWAFQYEYEIVSDEVAKAITEAEFILTLPVKDLLELHDILQALPATLVASAELTKN